MEKKEEFINPIREDMVAADPGLLPYAHSVSGAVVRPEDLGKMKSRALISMEEQTNIQLRQIERQIRLLAEQANDIKRRTEISLEIYSAEMGFEPIVGHIYHLYSYPDSRRFLSMIGPGEWGRSTGEREYLATVKMLGDHTWEIIREASPSDK